jgi:predicted cation transporter
MYSKSSGNKIPQLRPYVTRKDLIGIMIFGLTIILILVLFLPFTIKQVEHNLEAFLFIMGLAAAAISQVLDSSLIITALEDPIKITLAVLIAGLLFRWCQSPIEKGILGLSQMVPTRLFFALVVIILGLISSVITAIIAAIVLVVIVSVLRLDRQSEIRLVVLACFSIGLGAALTPIGEPLSTIAISKLNEQFFYLLELIGTDVIAAIIIFGILAAIIIKPQRDTQGLSASLEKESYKEILIRAFKIYLFVMGLTLLGAGFEPFIERYLLGLSPLVLYWINMISAVLDNATLAAAEISPAMDSQTIKAILLGLLISGGMLIPGNIPNIISAGKLNITSKEWAKFGLPVGLITMVVYFLVILLLG